MTWPVAGQVTVRLEHSGPALGGNHPLGPGGAVRVRGAALSIPGSSRGAVRAAVSFRNLVWSLSRSYLRPSPYQAGRHRIVWRRTTARSAKCYWLSPATAPAESRSSATAAGGAPWFGRRVL